MKIKELPKHERPREKLVEMGSSNLKDYELLAILLRTGRAGKNALEIAQLVLKKHPMKQLLQLSFDEITAIEGIDSSKACTLIAAFELSRRVLEVNDTSLPVLLSPTDVVAQLTDIRGRRKEHFVVLYCNSRHQLIARETISVGTLTDSPVHPREVFEPALRHLAASVFITHNHPSGDPTPSPADKQVTTRLIKAGSILGIELLDHIIVTEKEHFSFREQGALLGGA